VLPNAAEGACQALQDAVAPGAALAAEPSELTLVDSERSRLATGAWELVGSTASTLSLRRRSNPSVTATLAVRRSDNPDYQTRIDLTIRGQPAA
jgi:2-polyprenyl-6-methoxyphenol hydroxylase-like FAD-dependent oxidoreductase